MSVDEVGNSELLQQQQEACDRMMSALHDVIRQEQDVRNRVEGKKGKLAELHRQRDSGDSVQSSYIMQKQQTLDSLNKEIEELELAYKYHKSPYHHIQRPRPELEVSSDVPPPLPPRTATRFPHAPDNAPSDMEPDQWLCVRCGTVNNNLMPFCASPNCTK